VEQLGCPFVAVNLSVGLSLSMPSIALKVAGTVGHCIFVLSASPHASVSAVGVHHLCPGHNSAYVCRGTGDRSTLWQYDNGWRQVRQDHTSNIIAF
jgi:hypothetical protein